jgi:hypothetical protein
MFPALCLLVSVFLFHRSTTEWLGTIPVLRVATAWVVVLVLIGFGLKDTYTATHATFAAEPKHLLTVAQFLREHSSPGDIIFARKPQLPYLTGLTNKFPTSDNAEEFLTKARQIGVRYVVYSPYEAQLEPSLDAFRDPAQAPPGFSLVYRHDASKTMIYEMSPELRASGTNIETVPLWLQR